MYLLLYIYDCVIAYVLMAGAGRRRRLSEFITHYEPVYYDRQTILQRTTRSTPDFQLQPLRFTMRAYDR